MAFNAKDFRVQFLKKVQTNPALFREVNVSSQDEFDRLSDVELQARVTPKVLGVLGFPVDFFEKKKDV